MTLKKIKTNFAYLHTHSIYFKNVSKNIGMFYFVLFGGGGGGGAGRGGGLILTSLHVTPTTQIGA